MKDALSILALVGLVAAIALVVAFGTVFGVRATEPTETESIEFEHLPASADPTVGALEGTVVDEAGAPLANARLTLRFDGSTRSGVEIHSRTATGRRGVDERGRFRIDGIEPGRIKVGVRRDDDHYRGESEWLEIRPGQLSKPAPIRVAKIRDDELIEGIVVDTTGDPISFASIRYDYRVFFGGAGSLGAATNESGRFVIRVDPGAKGDLLVEDPKGRWQPIVARDLAAGTQGLKLRFEP